jgi:thymidylate kinase
MSALRRSSDIKCISFSGIDGAGKSTQIEALRARLTQDGLKIRLITFWDDVARLTKIREATGHRIFRGDKGVGTPLSPINRRDKNVRSWLLTSVRMFLYFVDAISLRSVVRGVLRSDVDLVIFDRYTYDELANLALCNPAIRVYVRLIMKFVPKPHISYLLDADPVQARARKPEYPIDFLYSNRLSYLTLSELVGGMTVIAPMSIREAQQAIVTHAKNELSFKASHPGTDGPMAPRDKPCLGSGKGSSSTCAGRMTTEGLGWIEVERPVKTLAEVDGTDPHREAADTGADVIL